MARAAPTLGQKLSFIFFIILGSLILYIDITSNNFQSIKNGFKSFYNEAWPYLRKNKIPFILFISTEPVGKYGYMSWDEIKEIDKSELGYIGHHSHTHEHLIDMSETEFIKDIEKG